ncbi:protein disulfide-isomerase A5 [Scaptodrosophila lebanonensis]|uniref:Protein disulfide-isomerase A5 n=1 Tax=Drosophila lebanonensis TaxID=7225 RepID=A0A6J2TJR8_DROLE|nr:protein disulfide-isomerase A5 [Scaptodrosophila lebanonensis]
MTYQPRTFVLLLLFLALVAGSAAKTKASAVQEDIAEYKDFKKLLRTKNNVLVIYVASPKAAGAELKVFREAAEGVRGTGTMVYVDCGQQERKKLCKKLKITPDPYTLKHYKDGDYHKDYDRQLSVASMVTFMRDPSGDLPWEEDPAGSDVLHFTDAAAFSKHLRKDIRPMLVMFHVPWCGFCKRMKPDYAKAASELKAKGGYLLAAMNVERQENAPIRKLFNITGFPTLIYFENGKLRFTYEGENTKDALVDFMLNPNAKPTPKPKEPEWSEDSSSEIAHLTADSFEATLKDEPSVLVMFYAPWCGHCKRMKPEYEKAALELKQSRVPGMLAALDATKEQAIAEKYKVKGYPTVKFFAHGVFKFDVNVREASKIVEFMRDPTEPPPPPPPEKSWEEEEQTEVLFLNDETFATTLKRKKHVLVMFYAPWCGHCKHTKPEFTAAANALQDDPRVAFAAVDCTQHSTLCAKYNVRGYPTILYFSYLKTKLEYNGGRTTKDFIAYVNNPPSATDHSEL